MTKIHCPHCNYVFDESDMENSDKDLYAICPKESYEDIQCPKCELIFWVEGGYIPTYKTFKTEEDFDNR